MSIDNKKQFTDLLNKIWSNVKFSKVSSNVKDSPELILPEIVLSGRSNAGKSSLVNALANNNSLAKVSQTPGKTQLIIYFNCANLFYLTDLPGYGYSAQGISKSRKFMQLADNYFAVEMNRPISLVLLLLDSRHLPSKADILMHEFLQARDIPYLIILNKIDKISRQELDKNKKEILKSLRLALDYPCFCVSTQKKQGLSDLRTAIVNFILHEAKENED